MKYPVLERFTPGFLLHEIYLQGELPQNILGYSIQIRVVELLARLQSQHGFRRYLQEDSPMHALIRSEHKKSAVQQEVELNPHGRFQLGFHQ